MHCLYLCDADWNPESETHALTFRPCTGQRPPRMGIVILYAFIYMNKLPLPLPEIFVHYKLLIFNECQIAGLLAGPASLFIDFVNILFQIY